MPFLVYESAMRTGGVVCYSNPQHVPLAGNGLIQSACRRLLGNADVGWTIEAVDLLRAGKYDQPENHALVIDTAPRRPTVSLFEVRSISGYSYAEWTPIMLTFEQLFVDAEVLTTPDEMKRMFTDENCKRCIVKSILYLNGGYAGGDWKWGGNSRTTGALLWDDAWSYFQKYSGIPLRPKDRGTDRPNAGFRARSA